MLLTASSASVSAPNWARQQAAMFPLVQSATITNAGEVTQESIADYFNALVDQKVCDLDKGTHDGAFNFVTSQA